VPGESKRPTPPPPAIGSDRVLHYALLDKSVSCKKGHGLLFADGEEIAKVPGLAICQSRNSSDVVMYYCDADWNSVAVSVHDSPANAKRRAEIIYPGSAARWTEARTSEEQVNRYLDEMYKDFRCSFCGKRGDLVGHMFSGSGSAQICDQCVEEFHSGISGPSSHSG
jgi:ClpX C4-type zinc finger